MHPIVRARGRASLPSIRFRDTTAGVAVFILALAARAGTVWNTPGGFGGNLGYDAGVYYASASALAHGRLPYRDFVLLHPPGITLATLPFAALGSLIGDHRGFVLADLAFMALGAANASLVYLVARAARLGRGASLAGALLYASWFSAIHADLSIRLEPLSGFAFLAGLYLLLRRRNGRSTVLAGALFGVAVLVKIWWIAPVAVVVLWLAVHRPDRGRAALVAVGVAGACVVIGGPFFVMAPGRMWHMLVSDQVGRGRNESLGQRLRSLSSAPDAFPHDLTVQHVLAVAILVLMCVGVGLSLRHPRLQVVGFVVVAQCVVLALAPSFFAQYSGYLTGTAAVAFAAGISTLNRTMRVPRAGTLLAGCVLALCTCLPAAAIAQASPGISSRLRLDQVRHQVRAGRCVVSDAPFALIAADVLSRNLRRGCVQWIDVVGVVYDIEGHNGRLPRKLDPRWQRALRGYLGSADVIILMRPSTGVSAPVLRSLGGRPHVDLGRGVRVYLPSTVRPGPTQP